MKQARVLNKQELQRLLAVVEAGNHAARNRLAIALSFYAGLRVGEIAQLYVGDVLGNDKEIAHQLYLNPSRTKHGNSRTVF